MTRDWRLHFEWKPRDCFIGAYWRHYRSRFDLWICLLPMVPLHFSRWGLKQPQEPEP